MEWPQRRLLIPLVQTAPSRSATSVPSQSPMCQPAPSGPAVARVQSGQLTVTKEAGETRLGIANPLLATFERRRPALDTQELAGRAERVEMAGRQFTRHGFHCGP